MPRPERVSLLTHSTIIPKRDKHGIEKPVQLPKKYPAHEHACIFSEESWKIASQIGALNSSAALLCTAVEKMA